MQELKDNDIEALLSRPLIEDYKELFLLGDYDFITLVVDKDGKLKKHEKQEKALCILTDNETKEFGYGGAAGGAKSWTGCAWLVFMCLCFPDTRWFIGREELTRLMASTYVTFQRACKAYGLRQDVDWKFNGQYHYIQFTNGSRIDLLDLKFVPRDPYYERYGSTEYTGGWIEEGGEVNFGAYDTLRTRIGRYNNEKYGILPKLLVTLNPKKNWCHQTFWKPFKAGTLGSSVKFLQALATDNPHVDAGYIDQLREIKDKVKKQRLLFGNFDYDDDDNALMEYDAITDLFKSPNVERGKKYMTVDVARFGKDESRIYVWDNWLVIERIVLKKKSVTEVAEEVKKVAAKHRIPMSQTVADEDGVGGGVVDILRCKGFVNNSAPLDNPKTHQPQNYENLKTQCTYMAATCVNERAIGFSESVASDTEFKERFEEEAEQVKKRDADVDGKLKIVKKEDVKELLGRSPDDWDTFMMRQYFELKPKRTNNSWHSQVA